jgi:hypothetical protein
VHSNVYVSAMSEAPAPQTGTASLRIGALAARAEVTVDTLRLYEKLGLLPRPARTPAANLLSFDFGAPTGAKGLFRASGSDAHLILMQDGAAETRDRRRDETTQ